MPDYIELAKTIAQDAPEKCGDCIFPIFFAQRLGKIMLSNKNITINQARESLQKRLKSCKGELVDINPDDEFYNAVTCRYFEEDDV